MSGLVRGTVQVVKLRLVQIAIEAYRGRAPERIAAGFLFLDPFNFGIQGFRVLIAVVNTYDKLHFQSLGSGLSFVRLSPRQVQRSLTRRP